VKRALVTGASRGLGLALCEALKVESFAVLAACRRPTRSLQELGVTVIDGVDVASDESTGRLTAALGDQPIDLLICNAGVNLTHKQDLAQLDTDLVRQEFEVNAIGPLRTVRAALPHLGAGSKVCLISTYRPGMGAAKRNYGYQASKMAMNQLAVVLADELAERGVITVVLSPGPMNTDLMNEVLGEGLVRVDRSALQEPRVVARDIIERLAELSPADSGSWMYRTGERLSVPTRIFGH
jgi:NAD(P)-dependent dehydrogenase (short-subunit alcohol dehydrogenase family)